MKTLHKEIDYTSFTTGTGQANQESWFQDFDSGQDKNWVKIGTANQFAMYNAEYIDLAGLQVEDESIFFEAITGQMPYPPLIAAKTTGTPNPPAGASLILQDIITTIPLDLDNFQQFSLDYFGGFGFKDSQYDFEHIVYFRSQTWTTDVDFQGYICNLTNSSQCGSGMPTASDRLYCYRILVWTAQCQNARITVPPLRFVLAVTPKKEHDVEYIYRLKRSYELQQTFDRD